MKLIKKEYINKVFPLCVALLMSIIMSWYITFINIWYTSDFLNMWFTAWYNAFLLALPISYIVVPTVRKSLEKVSY